MSCTDVSRTRLRTLVRCAGACLMAAALAAQTRTTHAETPRTVRIVSLPAPSGLTSVEASRRLSAARENGIDTVLIPVSLYDGSDAEAIDAIVRNARERGLRVHASVRIMLAAPAGPLPASRDHVIYRHPEWLMVPRAMAIEMQAADPRRPDYLGRLARWTRTNADRVDGLYVSPLQPDAAAYLSDALRRLVTRHPVDGIHLEGVRFPARDFDFSAGSLEAFRTAMRRTLAPGERVRIDDVEAIDPFGYPDELPEEWRRFRTTGLTALIAQLRTAVHSVRPDAIVSAAAVRGAERALAEHLQDWRTWFDNGFVSALTGAADATTALLYSYDALIDAVDRAPVAAAPAAPPSP